MAPSRAIVDLVGEKSTSSMPGACRRTPAQQPVSVWHIADLLKNTKFALDFESPTYRLSSFVFAVSCNGDLLIQVELTCDRIIPLASY